MRSLTAMGKKSIVGSVFLSCALVICTLITCGGGFRSESENAEDFLKTIFNSGVNDSLVSEAQK